MFAQNGTAVLNGLLINKKIEDWELPEMARGGGGRRTRLRLCVVCGVSLSVVSGVGGKSVLCMSVFLFICVVLVWIVTAVFIDVCKYYVPGTDRAVRFISRTCQITYTFFCHFTSRCTG